MTSWICGLVSFMIFERISDIPSWDIPSIISTELELWLYVCQLPLSVLHVFQSLIFCTFRSFCAIFCSINSNLFFPTKKCVLFGLICSFMYLRSLNFIYYMLLKTLFSYKLTWLLIYFVLYLLSVYFFLYIIYQMSHIYKIWCFCFMKFLRFPLHDSHS